MRLLSNFSVFWKNVFYQIWVLQDTLSKITIIVGASVKNTDYVHFNNLA